MNVPIIYSPHQVGLKKNSLDHLFVPLSLSSVAKSNPDTDIFFLNVNDNYPISIPGVTDVDAKSFYSEACEPIRNVYKHLSTNQADFELFCMERFFVLNKFMQENAIDRAFLIETDVLLFDDLNSYLDVNDGLDSSQTYLSENKCISLAYVTKEYLDYYCNYIVDCYSNSEKLSKIEEFYAKYHENGGMGGICDMTFCDYINKGMYGADKKFQTRNMSKVYKNSSGEARLFDSFIGRDFILDEDTKFKMTHSYIDNKRIKEIHYFDCAPFCSFLDGNIIKISSLHCQGNAKGLMADIFVNVF